MLKAHTQVLSYLIVPYSKQWTFHLNSLTSRTFSITWIETYVLRARPFPIFRFVSYKINVTTFNMATKTFQILSVCNVPRIAERVKKIHFSQPQVSDVTYSLAVSTVCLIYTARKAGLYETLIFYFIHNINKHQPSLVRIEKYKIHTVFFHHQFPLCSNVCSDLQGVNPIKNLYQNYYFKYHV